MAVVVTITEGMLATARAAAESLMVDACTIKRQTGTTEDANGVVTPTYAAPFYTGRCKVQARDVDAQNPEAGDAVHTVLRLRVDVPMSVTGVEVDDVVTITSSVYDPDLATRRFRVVAPFHKSQATARRLPVEETP